MLIRRRYLGQIFVDLGMLGIDSLNSALKSQEKLEKDTGKPYKLGEILIKQNKITPLQLKKALEVQKKEAENIFPPDLLKKAYILNGLTNDEIELLASYFVKENFKVGKVIFPQFGKPDKMYIIARGKIEVLIKTDSGTQRDIVYELEKGDVFGELAFIDRGPRSATVKTKTNSTIVSLKIEDYEKIIRMVPHIETVILKNLAKTLSKRLRDANELLKKTFKEKKEKRILGLFRV